MLKRIPLQQLFKIHPEELGRCLLAFALFFCLLCAYYILRPMRDSMAVTGGIDQLHWLFTATFFAILLVVLIYGWACSHLKRVVLIASVYSSVFIALLIFCYLFSLYPDNVWLARVFYVWVSVINLLIISVFWSLMVDVFRKDQAYRVFGFIAAGGSLGGLFGPLLSALLVKELGHQYLLLISALGFGLVIIFSISLLRLMTSDHDSSSNRLLVGGHPFSGFSLLIKTPYLIGYALFVLCLSTISTFLYFQQAELVGISLPDAKARTELFAWIDFVVNLLSVTSQFILTGNIVKKFGVSLILTVIPAVLMLGFVSFVVYPHLSIVIAVIMIRRVGSYAFIRPCREMLFTTLSREMKYKAKNLIDTVIYRGGDAASSWFYSFCVGLGLLLPGTAIIGAVFAIICSVIGYQLGKVHYQSTLNDENRDSPIDAEPLGYH